MTPPASAQKSAPTPAGKRAAEPALDARDRRLLFTGLACAALFAVGLFALMIALRDFDAKAPDPDAKTPIIPPDYPRHLVDFSLTDQAGHAVTRADLQGQFVVVDFVFTSCSATCPYVSAQMERIQRETAGQPVRLVSITLDPADDTAVVLGRYAPTFQADISRWSFLTGDLAAIRHLVGTSFLPPDTTGQFAYMPGNFAHVQRIALVDPAGNVVSYFDGLNDHTAENVVAKIKELEAKP
jgi:protein SCO1/2